MKMWTLCLYWCLHTDNQHPQMRKWLTAAQLSTLTFMCRSHYVHFNYFSCKHWLEYVPIKIRVLFQVRVRTFKCFKPIFHLVDNKVIESMNLSSYLKQMLKSYPMTLWYYIFTLLSNSMYWSLLQSFFHIL